MTKDGKRIALKSKFYLKNLNLCSLDTIFAFIFLIPFVKNLTLMQFPPILDTTIYGVCLRMRGTVKYVEDEK